MTSSFGNQSRSGTYAPRKYTSFQHSPEVLKNQAPRDADIRREAAIEEYVSALACRAIRHAETIIYMRQNYASVLQALLQSCKALMSDRPGASRLAAQAVKAGTETLIHSVSSDQEAQRTLELVDGPKYIDDVLRMQAAGLFSLEEEKQSLTENKLNA